MRAGDPGRQSRLPATRERRERQPAPLPVEHTSYRTLMDTSQLDLIRRSWASVEASGPRLAERFYGRLFELDPSLRDLFTVTDMGSQNKKFMDMMREVVRVVDEPNSLDPLLEESGRRHHGYGVRPSDYHTVGEAFLWAIEKGLPEPFDAETQAAWAAGYSLVASIMRRAGDRQAPSSPRLRRADW